MTQNGQQLSISKTVHKTLRVIDFLSSANREVGITEIARNLKINTTTIQRIVNTLHRSNYVQQNPGTARYTLGIRFLEISHHILHGLDLRRVARRFLEELRDRTRETVHLMILDGTMGVYIDAVESPQRVRMVSAIGTREELHCSAVGKALLAFLPDQKVNETIREQGLKRKTSRTITDPDELKRHLGQIKRRGYSVDNEEGEEGTRCVGAPIFGHSGEVQASISVAAPSYRLDLGNIPQLAPTVIEAATKISKSLGKAF
jgi:IclR family acetate operon transcriptional repressor